MVKIDPFQRPLAKQSLYVLGHPLKHPTCYLAAHCETMDRRAFFILKAYLEPKFDFKLQYLDEVFPPNEYHSIFKILVKNGNFK